MKPIPACLLLVPFVFASCDKTETKAKRNEIPSQAPQVETRTKAPAIAEKIAPAPREAPQTIERPVDASMIRPAGTAPDDGSWETLTAEQMIEKFNSSGIARMPKDVSDKILADAASAGAPEDQVNFITQQSAAWHHINSFNEDTSDIPDHMRKALLERLSTKHGESWKDMVPELEEQVAASAKVMELRLNGIPGMSPDESHDLLINALEKHGPDYKTILSIAEQSARK